MQAAREKFSFCIINMAEDDYDYSRKSVPLYRLLLSNVRYDEENQKSMHLDELLEF